MFGERTERPWERRAMTIDIGFAGPGAATDGDRTLSCVRLSKLARDKTHSKANEPLALVGTVRANRCLHKPHHWPSGTWLSSDIVSASSTAEWSTDAPDHLHL